MISIKSIIPTQLNSKDLRFKKESGMTFIEVMVTVVVLTVGIVMIFKSYLTSLTYMEHLTNRIFVTTILDHKMAVIERKLRAYKTLPFELGQTEKIKMGLKSLDIREKIKITEVNGVSNVFYCELEIEWKEHSKKLRLSRSAYISHLGAASL